MFRKMMLLMAAVVLMAGVGVGTAFAANPATANVYLNCTVTLSVTTVSPDNMYNFGNVAAGSVNVSTAPIVFRNDSAGAICRWDLNVGAVAGWTIGAAPGLDTYRLCAKFVKTAQPVAGDYDLVADTMSTVAKEYNATNYYDADYNADGHGSDASKIYPFAYDNAKADRKLWLRLDTPTAVTSSGSKVIPVVVTAKISG